MAEKIQLSVVILVKNESDRIRECIESVLWADEILVVDDCSSDDTVSIAQSMGARVVHRKMDIEGRHRNWAHSQAKHDWILSIDADERVTSELAKEIQELFSTTPNYQIYDIPRKNYIGDQWIRYGGWYPSAQVKLFNRNSFKWEETTVHPRAISNSKCGTLQKDLLHYSYRSVEDMAAKLERHTELEARKWIMDGRKASLLRACRKVVDRFIRSFLLKQGFRDGQLGFVVAWMAGRYQWLSYAKYTQMQRQKKS